ncbi:MAG: Alpha/beta hydrolase family protein [candidate division BRC1 bacterium ADurb.BinA364]|nr:MAG: Alpha/beta hydrolase family protein [candidate division BRC1 bacterium ADurb.BinA364]
MAEPPGIDMTPVVFSDGVAGCFYMPKEDRNLPLVVWLGPFQVSQGYAAPFYRCAFPAPAVLLCEGFPVFAYDPIGTFLRQNERRDFFSKAPDASLMAKMVCDARHAIDAAQQALKKPRPIALYGYAMGGMTAIFTAALDERVSAAACVAGFTPLRSDTSDKRTGGIARLSHLYGWLPRLGAFIGREDRIPVDFPEILASIAPRRLLIVAPELDRYATHGDVLAAAEYARGAYRMLGAENAFEIRTPFDENRLTDAMQNEAIEWLKP